MTLSELATVFRSYNRFVLASHESPDGDSIGSQLALYWYLQSIGKTVHIVNQDPVPQKFRFLKNSDAVSQQPCSGDFDCFIIVDSSNPTRLGYNSSEYQKKPIINIDHHRDNSCFGTHNYIDTHSAATGEILFAFFSENNVAIAPHVAETLYVAIMTDTGGFRFSNTTESVLHSCAELTRLGASPSQLYARVFSSFHAKALLFRSHILSTLRYYCGGKIGSMGISYELYAHYNASADDSEGMADQTIACIEAEVGFFYKYDENKTHFSLRSKGTIDVGKIASLIPGGGGHHNAAGCTIELPVERAHPLMISLIEQELTSSQ